MNLNKTMIAGTIGNDIELRYTPKGTAVCDISLAINRKYKQDDQPKEETTWVEVTLWGRTAEIAHEYTGKGKPLFIEGRLQLDEWTDKETGAKRTKLKVVADNIQLLNGRGDSGQQQPSQPAQQAQTPRPDDENDDIPF